MTSIHHRTIATLILTQRLLNICPLERDYYPPIAFKKIMARIRITQETMNDLSGVADAPFIAAMRSSMNALCSDLSKP